MAKLYLFAIGGTGARVLRSFTMLAAAGLEIPKKFTDVIPILIDPDHTNGDSRLTAELIQQYQQIRKKLHKPNNFFNIKINTLEQFTNSEGAISMDSVFMDLEGYESEDRFKDFINYYQLNETDKALVDLLFTEADLDLALEVGFKGNPNIGSIVLNKFKDSPVFQKFTGTFTNGDAIFIISSIFGGTGAAGFPLLLKNLRSDDINIDGHTAIANAKIGAISYMPYYKIGFPPKDKERNIDSGTFFERAKAALNYYDHAIFKNKSLEVFYFTGEDTTTVLPYAEGKSKQQNPAHFLEYAGALSIKHFAEHIDYFDRSGDTAFYEFGIERATETIEFTHLGASQIETIARQLSAFTLFERFLNIQDKPIQNKRDKWQKNGGFERAYFGEVFYASLLAPFMEQFRIWITEMTKNNPAFDPYFGNRKFDHLINFIRGKDIQNKWFDQKASAGKIISALNRKVKSKQEESDAHFMQVMGEVTTEIINDIIK